MNKSEIKKNRLQKVQIISNLQGYGPLPEPKDVIEQRLTISSDGRVWFTEYLFGDGRCEKRPIGRQLQLSISEEIALDILSKVDNYLEEDPITMYCTDIGDWKLIATDFSGNEKQLSGSLCGEVMVDEVDLTDFIMRSIPIEGLVVFG